MQKSFEALMIVSFGGPESHAEVMPFLERVTQGKPVPRERLLEVAKHYYHFDGKSPLNAQNRALKQALEKEFLKRNIGLPIYLGNRNAAPFIVDELREMKAKNITRALGFFTSSMSSYSGCRQYRENIAEAQAEIGDGAPQIEKIRAFFNHPLYIQTVSARLQECLSKFSMEKRDSHFIFTTHSLPISMAKNCDYAEQYKNSSELVAAANVLQPDQVTFAFQSRSGSPHIPWLGPDVNEVVKNIPKGSKKNIIFIPIGFVSDHMEVIYDLDCEAREHVENHGFQFARVKTAGTHPLFIEMICELVAERLQHDQPRRYLGSLGARVDVCPPDCCLKG